MVAISQLPVGYPPLSGALAAVDMGGHTLSVPTEAFGVPLVQSTAPIAVADYQTWIDTSTTIPTLRMHINGAWVGLFEINTDGTMVTVGPLTLPADPTLANHAATKHYVDNLGTLAGRVVVKGAIDCSTNPNYPAANEGDLYYVSVAGKIGGGSGLSVSTDVALLCKTNATASGPQSTAGASWFVLSSITEVLALIAAQALAGDVTGTPGATAVSKIAGVPLSADVLLQGQGWVYDAASTSLKARSNEGKNYLINAAFDIWQENTTYSLSSSAAKTHVADYWKVGCASTNRTLSRVAGITNSRYALKVQRAAGNTILPKVVIAQQLSTEESMFLAGRNVTVSLDFVAGANYSPLNGPFVQILVGTGIDEDIDLHVATPAFTTGGSTIASGSLAAQVAAVGTVARLITIPLAVPAGTTEIAVAIVGGNYAGTAGADDSYTFGNVKLEVGNVATHFRKVDVAEELVKCQRRYWKTFLQSAAPAQATGPLTGEHRSAATKAGAVAQTLGTARFPATMRIAPAITFFSPTSASAQARDFTASADCTSTAAQNVSDNACEIITTGASGTAVGNTLGVHVVADARL